MSAARPPSAWPASSRSRPFPNRTPTAARRCWYGCTSRRGSRRPCTPPARPRHGRAAAAGPSRREVPPVADRLSERDELTLRTLAFIERTTVAEQRRQALREYAARARQDEDVAEIVRLMLASWRERQTGANVIRLGRKRS